MIKSKKLNMKKFLLSASLIAVVLFSANTSQAQLIQWGIKGGINSSTLTGLKDQATVDNVSRLTSWHAGALLQVNVPIITVQLDAVYSVQGAKTTSSGTEDKIENAYINLPLVAKLKILSVLNIQAGLQYGILVSSKVNGEKEVLGVTYKDFYKGGDWAIPVGLGLQVSKLLVDLRYNIGVADITDISASTVKINNGVFQASVGLVF